MAEYMEKASKNLQASRELQKLWYDQKGAMVEFQPGHKVWVLEHVAPMALQDKWSGPYPILKKKREVTYLVDLGSCKNHKRIIHVNHIKPLFDRADLIMLLVTDEGQEDESEPLPDPQDSFVDGVILSDTLSKQQQTDCRKIPSSLCCDICPPGTRKAIRKDQPICCYDCVPCSDGEMSNQTDVDSCITCPEDQWSNENKDACIPRTIEFLSYDDPFGVTLASISISFSVITAAVLVIFLKHRDSAIVRANNRDLTYILLVSLMLSFLCSMLFIGRPQKVTCLLRQVAFGIIFAVAVSSVLAKSITVVIAFNATKPGSRLRRWVGSRVSYSLILLCTLWEVIICTVWLIHWPPFPDIDTKSESGKMILLCNEGSVAAFYCVVVYVGLLALLSFLVAFKVRKLPDSFNEARNISFSMLVLCSVWVSFIPAYLITKGRYMVAVEIFAVLASGSGLLGCIFIPKCYIILLRPELNTKEQLIKKNNHQN
ncbi:vomeronasal type-2 receptor 26-like [Pleurodeles waltl]|uniref:vomeronasal type-2 receptor 26-like n=1 Tax=Pleurodeles waltl TaxID=8319 RepID=UPI0037098CE3